jgi:putative transposase
MMQSLGRRFARYANERDGSCGARWLGRYHSCPVGGKAHVPRAYAFVERAPSRAGAVLDPNEYQWSSYACNALGSADSSVTPHLAYLALSAQTRTRLARYRALLAQTFNDDAEILMHVQQGRAWGSAGFLRRIATICGEAARARARGRPRTAQSKASKIICTTLSPFLLTGWIGLQQTLAAAMEGAFRSARSEAEIQQGQQRAQHPR